MTGTVITLQYSDTDLFKKMREMSEKHGGMIKIPATDRCYNYQYMAEDLYKLDECAEHGWRPEYFRYAEDIVEVYMRGFGDNANNHACRLYLKMDYRNKKVSSVQVNGWSVYELNQDKKIGHLTDMNPAEYESAGRPSLYFKSVFKKDLPKIFGEK